MNIACNPGQIDIKRGQTAITRRRHSKPVALALAHGIIDSSRSVFDYGCGRGEDVKYLTSARIQATGWDPHHQPETPISPADVVNLGYVLNVIEDPDERDETLRRAFGLARCALVVAVRVEKGLDIGSEFSDGFLTSHGSFQKLYKQSEFKDYVERLLSSRLHLVGPGIAYVFKDDLLESSYISSLSLRRVEASRTQAIEDFSHDPVAIQFTQMAAALGRPPLPNEFSPYPELLTRFGSSDRIERLALRLLSPETIQQSQNKRRDDILTYIAMMRLQGLKPLPFHCLPEELRADIKTLWPSYSAALQQGEAFLFQLGHSESVRKACQGSPVGKQLPEALYVHPSAEEQLGALLRLLIFAARQLVGEVDYNIIKISKDGRSISFLHYNDFDQDAHPTLLRSIRVDLPRAVYSIREYCTSTNPPLLHRKETFVDPLYPGHKTFSDLTRQEEELGLLSRPDIGTRQGWLAILAERNLTITGHILSNVDGTSENSL